MNPNNIPRELKALPNWVTWDKNKIPHIPGTLRKASVTDSATWRSFDSAMIDFEQGWAEGIGFVFTDTPYAGLDLDNCIIDGKLTHRAAQIVNLLNSYTEISPGGRGLHVIVRATLPPGPRRQPGVELYDTGRYFTFTGHPWPGAPITIRRMDDNLYHQLFPEQPSTPILNYPTGNGGEFDVLSRALAARNGDKFHRLWEGDTTGYPSHSEADLALCSMLAYWSQGNPVLVDILFRQSQLYRDKWDEVHYADGRTYGEATIQQALA